MKTLRLSVSLILFLFPGILSAQYSKPQHSKGICYKENGKPVTKGQISSVKIYKPSGQLVYNYDFAADLDCDSASSKGYFREYTGKNYFYLSEGQTYTLEVDVVNPDSSTDFSPAQVWIDYNRDSSFDGSNEQLIPLRKKCNSINRNVFRFTIPQTSTGQSRLRIRTMLGTSGTSSSPEDLGESIDVQLKLFSRSKIVSDFWAPDTISKNALVDLMNANPFDKLFVRWFLDDSLVYWDQGTDLAIGKSGWVEVKLVTYDLGLPSDTMVKKIYVSDSVLTKDPVFGTQNHEVAIYQSFNLIDFNDGINKFAKWELYQGKDTVTRLQLNWYKRSRLSKTTTINTAPDLKGFPGAGLWGVCLYSSPDTSNPNLTKKTCIDNYIQVSMDTTPPVITLIGPDTLCMPVSPIFTDAGATAADGCDGDITTQIIAASNVDSYKEGQYYVQYSVQDAYGNADTITRVVLVGKCGRHYYKTGRVYADLDGDCKRDSNEPGMSILIENDRSITYSNRDGAFGMFVYRHGEHHITPVLPDHMKPYFKRFCITNDTFYVDSVSGIDTSEIVIGVQLSPCPVLSVNVSSTRRRPCFRGNTIITYQNDGYVDQDSVFVTVDLARQIHLLSANKPFKINNEGEYVFYIGKLEALSWGSISIIDSVTCDIKLLGLTQCSRAWISPLSHCIRDSSGWDGSDLTISGACQGDTSVKFVIKNDGKWAKRSMSDSTDYHIYIGNNLRFSSKLKLDLNDSLIVRTPIPTNFTLNPVRIEAFQSGGHPYSTFVRSTIANCDDSTKNSAGLDYVSDDKSPLMDKFCTRIVNSFDPNDKHVHPEGFGKQNLVPPSIDLEFTIRFQNTGSDTAYLVRIVDTLDSDLRYSSIRFGSSSHSYEPKLNTDTSGNVFVEFVFDEIDLPDSNINPTASRGFVQYMITIDSVLSEDHEVTNNADIYFDYNTPIRTNTVHVIVFDSIPVGDRIPVVEKGKNTNCFVQTTITLSNKELEATLDGVRYQWLDCENSYAAIKGAKLKTFAPVSNGIYAVQTLFDECADTSDCMEVSDLATHDLIFEDEIVIYPVPSKSSVTIQSNTGNNYNYEVTYLNGQILMAGSFSKSTEIDIKTPGVYLCHLTDEESGLQQVIKFVILQ